MTLLSKNLNTLPVMVALLEEGSVVAAARRVGLSQPSVSGILARLRVEFDDPLLIRSGRGMRLSPRAERLLPVLSELCRGLESVYAPEVFDPSRLDRRYVIAAPDHLAFLLTPGLLEHLTREAPGVRLQFVDVPADLDAQMAEQRIDLAVCGNFGTWPGLRRQVILRSRAVAAMWRNHPLASREMLTTEEILDYPSATMNSAIAPGRQRSKAATGVPSFDIEPRISLSQFTDLVLLTVGTMMIAPAPESLVRRLSTFAPIVGVRLAEADTVDETIFWSAERDHEIELQWVRSLITRVAADLET